MAEQQIITDETELKEDDDDDVESETTKHEATNNTTTNSMQLTASSRRDRRKLAKKEKKKQRRRATAESSRQEDEARLADPAYLAQLQAEEQMEKERVEREMREFEEREKKIREEWEARRRIEEEEEASRKRAIEEDELQLRRSKQDEDGCGNEVDEDGWEYVEDGPPEIIWQGNEIIVRKKKIKVKKKDAEQPSALENLNRPASNPLPPQSESYADYKNASALSAQQLLKSVAQETPNFGTEQDKAHCPFHLKTGACRFGTHCSRIHFYPDKSCTLLIKNMYNGPGLAWEQDEDLECTDEEVERAYEEFYEDVHTEFLKFGEIVNFKVCRNASSHLRGNVYVQYKSLDSAVMAYQSENGRYFAGKQLQCEFVGITRWKVAICGEFMKSKLQTCSRGMACNFIHCFRNPGGDYEWADLDKPPPRHWVKRMIALFGYTDEYGHERHIETASPRFRRSSSRILEANADSGYNFWRSRSRDTDYSRSSPEDHDHNSKQRSACTDADKEHQVVHRSYQHADKPQNRDKKHRETVRKGIYSSSRTHSPVPDPELDAHGEISIHDADLDERSDRNKYNHHRHSRSRRQEERSSSVVSTSSDRHRRESSRSYSGHSRNDRSEEYFEDIKSKIEKATGYDEVSEEAVDESRSRRSSDSSSRYHTRKKETDKLERRESNKHSSDFSRKSKQRRNLDKNLESGSKGREGKRSRATTDHVIFDEDLEDRGRWVPENDSSSDE